MMATGGIPVSGGITGYGTLIGSNLLYSPLLLDSDGNALARPSVTLGGTAGATGFAAARAVDRDPLTVWKTPAGAGAHTLTIDLGAAYTVYGVVLFGHNLTEAAIASALLEGGSSAACGDVSQALTINAATLTPAYHLLATPASKRYWQIVITPAASMAIQIGEVLLIGAPPLAFSVNYAYGYDDHEEIGTRSSTGLNGISRVTAQWVRRYIGGMVFNSAPSAQRDSMVAAARNGHVVFSPDGVSGPALLGIWRNESIKHGYADQWTITATFEEAPR
jgi:hypothetical protein